MKSRDALYGKKMAADLKLLVVLGRCVQSVERRMFPLVSETGLTPAQFSVLEMLYHKGPLTMNDIISKTLSSSGNIGVVVANLMKQNLVTKTIDSSDRRIRHVSLTTTGRKKISSFFPEHFQEIKRMFSCLSSEGKKQLTGLLKKLGKGV